ncbi:hypothetical protein C5O78_03495 [Treponema phagedenis]|nr:hypothetical protein C5O78_03495 [Treponema phagedenis]
MAHKNTGQEKSFMQPMKISRARQELMAEYATASVFLYGVLSIDEFVEVFNHYEKKHTTSKEALSALKKFKKTEAVDYSFFNDILSASWFTSEFDIDREYIIYIREKQNGKPRYLPAKKEFLKYTNLLYHEFDESYLKLKAHIIKHKLMPSNYNEDNLDEDFFAIYELFQDSGTPANALKYFTVSGYVFGSKDTLDEFVNLLTDMYNNTRKYTNNGFTSNELQGKSNNPKLRHTSTNLNIQTQNDFPLPVFDVVPKVGRNEPCPCGSGKKYKHCHGK